LGGDTGAAAAAAAGASGFLSWESAAPVISGNTANATRLRTHADLLCFTACPFVMSGILLSFVPLASIAIPSAANLDKG